jgi:nitrogenase molybdenum-iron protein alpha/beta subunit
MWSKALQVEIARERVKEGVEGAFIPPHPEYSRYSFKTQNIRGKPGNSGKSGESGVNSDTPASQGQHPRKDSRGRAGAKVSLIGCELATRAPVRLLEDTFHVPLYSTAFLGLKFKNIKQISLLRNPL